MFKIQFFGEEIVTISPEHRPRQWSMESGCCPDCMPPPVCYNKMIDYRDYISGRLGCRICQKVAMFTANQLRGSILSYVSIFYCFPSFRIKCCISGLKLKKKLSKAHFLIHVHSNKTPWFNEKKLCLSFCLYPVLDNDWKSWKYLNKIEKQFLTGR